MLDISRRGLLAAGAGLAAFGCAQDNPFRIRAEGAERALPDKMLGFNTPANYAIPWEQPAFAEAVKRLAPHYLRFPGGTVANYYDWRTGQLAIKNVPNGSIYRKYLFNQAFPNSRKLHPKGVFFEDFDRFAKQVGADVIFLPNLETSSAAEEAARFAHMHELGIVPNHIEMGNEFYLAMLMDPETLRIFPDRATAMAVTRTYYGAIRPYLPADAKVAVQTAASRFHFPDSRPPEDDRAVHEREWDDQLAPEPWFDAATIHLYPTASRSAGVEALKDVANQTDFVFDAMMARADEGYERAIGFAVSKMPGKEIWVTEWGGFEPAVTFSGVKAEFNGLWLHQVTRCMLAMLRRPEVTVVNYHALFARGDLSSIFRQDANGRWVPVNAASVLHLFFEAARGPDAHYQRVLVDGARRITANGNIPGEGYQDLEAALFRRGGERTLIVQNASAETRTIGISDIIGRADGLAADTIATPDRLISFQNAAPDPTPLQAGPSMAFPAYSVTRVRWSA